MSDDREVTAAIQAALGQIPGWSKDGCPKLDASSLQEIKWPKKLAPNLTVLLDTSPGLHAETWPAPRFEILAANLDAIGMKAVQCGGEDIARLSRVAHRFVNLSDHERAAAISRACLWIGMESNWRWIAAALDVPQVVITERLASARIWRNTFPVMSGKHVPESEVLGPISVTDVAEAVTKALKNKRSGVRV